MDDLNPLRQIAGCYGGAGSLERFLSDVSIQPSEKSDRRSSAATVDDEKPLTLSTIHSATALEWEAVFLLAVQAEPVQELRFQIRLHGPARASPVCSQGHKRLLDN